MKKREKNKEKKITESLLRLYSGKAETEDNNQIEQWLSKNQYAKKTAENLSYEEYLTSALEKYRRYEKSEKKNSFAEKLNRPKTRSISSLVSIATLIGAAIIVISFILFRTETNNDGNQISENRVEINKPILMTSGGDTVDIHKKEDIANGSIIAFTKIKKILQKKNDDPTSFNDYIIPVKCSSKIELEDGTIVHLNSRSKLRFPTSFNTDKRIVQLEGEGFFEVAKSAIPFIVEVDGVQVTVYGTKFNIKSNYDGIIETVLIEGSVGVKFGEEERRLTPKMMCRVDKSKKEISEHQVNTTKFMAWTENKFMYERDSLEYVIRELSYWYDEKIEFQNNSLKSLSVTLICQRKATFEEILNLIESSNINIKFIKTDYGYIVK